MPRIPVYTQKVEQGRLPGARVNLSVSPQDVTGGIEKALDAGADLAKDGLQKARKEQREARLMLAYSELGNARLEIQGVATKDYLGESALKNDLETQTTAMLKKRAEEVIASMPDDEMRNAVRRTYLREEEGLRVAVKGHVAKQGEAVAEGAYKSTLTTARSKAVAAGGEGRDAVAGREELIEAVRARGATLGWSKEETELRVKGELTGLHEGVIDRLRLASPARADAYLTLKEPEMLPEVVTKLRSEMKVGVVADRAEQEVRRIEGLTADPEERVRLVNALDPEIAPKARDVLRERAGLEEATRNDALNAQRGTLLNEIEKRTIRTATDLEKNADFQKLEQRDPGRAAQVRNYLDAQNSQRSNTARIRGAAQRSIDAQAEEWFERVIQTDPTQAAALDLRAELGGLRTEDGLRVSDEAIKRVTKRQTGVKAGVDKDGGVTEAEFQREAVRLAGPLITSKDREAAFVAAMSRRRAKWAAEQTDATKIPSTEEVQGWVAVELEWGDSTGGGLSRNRYRFENPEGEPFVPFPAEEQPYRAPTAGAVRGAPAALPPPPGGRAAAPRGPAAAPKPRTAADIPAAERKMIEAAMQKSGKKPSDPEIMRRYLLAHPEAR